MDGLETADRFPNACRCFAYRSDSSTHPCASPVASAAIAIRPRRGSAGLGEAATTNAEQIGLRHPDVFEGEFMGIRGAPADLGIPGLHGKAGRARRDQDRGQLLAPVTSSVTAATATTEVMSVPDS